jgi:hypothetical protein
VNNQCHFGVANCTCASQIIREQFVAKLPGIAAWMPRYESEREGALVAEQAITASTDCTCPTLLNGHHQGCPIIAPRD